MTRETTKTPMTINYADVERAHALSQKPFFVRLFYKLVDSLRESTIGKFWVLSTLHNTLTRSGIQVRSMSLEGNVIILNAIYDNEDLMQRLSNMTYRQERAGIMSGMTNGKGLRRTDRALQVSNLSEDSMFALQQIEDYVQEQHELAVTSGRELALAPDIQDGEYNYGLHYLLTANRIPVNTVVNLSSAGYGYNWIGVQL